jgi:uncharacterized protein YndB with AHSA1/START domain
MAPRWASRLWAIKATNRSATKWLHFGLAWSRPCATRRLRMTDRIEKTIELKAPVARVWRALTDHREFGQWFRVRLEGPFVPGQVAHGNITHPGYEHLRWEAVVQRMEPERLFSFTWHPYAIDPNRTIPASRRPWSSSCWSSPRLARGCGSWNPGLKNCRPSAVTKRFA